MIKKRLTAEQFDSILPGNASKGVRAARLVLVDGITYRAASESIGVCISSITQAIQRIERNK
jgi:hypothetical protein